MHVSSLVHLQTAPYMMKQINEIDILASILNKTYYFHHISKKFIQIKEINKNYCSIIKL